MIEKYETVLVLDGELPEEEARKEVIKIEEIIKAHSGTIENKDDWGKKQLSYKIKKKDYGYYTLLVYSAEGTVVSEMDRTIAINENFFRHLTVKKDKHAPDLSPHLKEEAEAEEAPAEAASQ